MYTFINILYLWQKQLYMVLHKAKIDYLDFYQMAIFFIEQQDK